MSSSISILQADGTTVAWPASPQRNLQPTGAGTIADSPQYTSANVAGGGPHPVGTGVRVMVADTNAGGVTVQLPDPRAGGDNLPNGYVVYVINIDNGGGGGNDITVQGASGGNILVGAVTVTGAGGGAPNMRGHGFMVFDHTNQDGWVRAAL